MKIKTRASLFLVLSLFSGATLPILLGFLSSANVYEVLFLIFSVNVPSALLLVIISKKTSVLLNHLKSGKNVAVMAIIGILMYLSMEFIVGYAEHYVSASLATVVFRTSPLLMLLFLPTLLREKLTKIQIIALLMCFIGLYAALSNGFSSGFVHNYPVILLLIGAALGYALTNVLTKRYSYELSSSLFIYGLFAFIFFALMFAVNGFPLSNLTIFQIAIIFYIGFVFNVYSFYIYLEAFRVLKTTLVTNVYFLSPFITFVFAFFLLGNPIKPYYILIAMITIVGVLLQRLDKTGGTYLAKSKNSELHKTVIFDVTGAFSRTGETSIMSSINKGSHVLAIKLDKKHSDKINSYIDSEAYGVLFTEYSEGIGTESNFVRDILGARNHEFVVMSIGNNEENEYRLNDIISRIDA